MVWGSTVVASYMVHDYFLEKEYYIDIVSLCPEKKISSKLSLKFDDRRKQGI